MKNKVKNNLLQSAAICAIVSGALVFIGVIVSFAMLDSEWNDFTLTLIFDILWLGMAVMLLVIGAQLCRKQNQWKKKPLIITAMAGIGASLLFVILFLALGGEFIFTIYIEIILGLGTIALFTTGLVLPDRANDNQTETQQKIELLRGLKDTGQLTEEEYKALLIKELGKNNCKQSPKSLRVAPSQRVLGYVFVVYKDVFKNKNPIFGRVFYCLKNIN